MMKILGIDPGSEESAYAIIDKNYTVLDAAKIPNADMVNLIDYRFAVVAVESIQSYGMAVGRSVFETCYMIGRIQQQCIPFDVPCILYPRPVYAKAIAGVGRVNDSILRQALLLRFGGDKKGEPLNRLKGNTDKRSAYAVACYHLDLII
jgi:Holliday junction resolvasome RuvABC endonuclease subunit